MSAFLFFNTLFTGVLAGLAYLGMPWIMDLLLAKADVAVRTEAIYLSRWLLLSPLLFSLANTLSSFLMSNKHYFSYSLGPVLYNVGIIISIAMFADTLGIMAAVYGVVLGLLLMLAVRLADFRSLKLKIRFRMWHTEIPESLRLAVYKVLSILSVQVSLMVFNFVAYGLESGSWSAFNYAKNVQSFAVSLFGIAISQAIFPYLIDERVNQNLEDLNLMIRRTFLKIFYFVWPACLGMFVIAGDLIPFLFERGEFDSAASRLTAAVLAVLALSIPFESINHLLSKVYYAFLDTLKPVLISIVFLASNVLMAIYLGPLIGVAAFGFGYVFGSFLQALALLYFLKCFGLRRDFILSRDTLKIFLSGLIMFGSVLAGNYLDWHVLIQVLIGVLVYFLCTLKLDVLKCSDLDGVLKKMFGKVFKLK